MPSTTRGSILISTANDIGEALVDKLGGVGYSPNEWKEKYNLCGIAPVDSAPALSVLSDSAGTGDERGSILIATADAIGAILNKKYNVLRGFKPKEWASACRKMKALEEGSVASDSIASFSDGADDVPTKSLVVTIPPTLSGVSQVTETQTGKNLMNQTFEIGSVSESAPVGSTYAQLKIASTKRGRTEELVPIPKAGRYTFSCASPYRLFLCYFDQDQRYLGTYRGWSGVQTFYVDFSNTDKYVGIAFKIDEATDITSDDFDAVHLQIEYSDTASTFEPYSGTQYTAQLGRIIYGGVVDIVNGEGTDENGNDFTFTGQEINTRLGYNAFWSDSGDTAVEYYKAPTPYARKTATGGIANFSDQRTDLPLTKAIANIAPSIAGKSAVNLYQQKKNLLNANDSSYTFQVGDNFRYNCGTVALKKGVTYTFSALQEDDLTSNTRNTLAIGVNEVYTYESATGSNYHNQSGVHSMQYTPSEDCEAVFVVLVHTPSNAVKYSAFMLEVGSTASAYVPYSAPATYAAELGETVYGGSVDFVSGEVEKICGKITFNGSENWSAYTTGNGYAIPLAGMERGTWYTSPLALSYPLPKVPNNDSLGVRIGVNNDGIYVVQANTIEGVTDITSFKDYLSENPLTIIYPLATPTESTIPGRVISPIEGVNNYWNDAGGDTEIQYFENET